MLMSLALLFLSAMGLGQILKKLNLPTLLAYLITGIILGPYALNLLAPNLLTISADLRQLALIIILTRAGLSLNLSDLKKVGRPAILMCFVPASIEMLGTILLAPPLLGLSYPDAALLGSVLAAVSPAVVIPKMLRLMEEGYGQAKRIPQLIMASASVDDVFVIVFFTAFMDLSKGEAVSATTFLRIPLSITTGLLVGLLIGTLLAILFKHKHIRDTIKVILLISFSFLLVAAEQEQANPIPFSGLLAVMASASALQWKRPVVADRLAKKFAKLWVAAEILLFVLVGATVDMRYALAAEAADVVLLLLGLLIFRLFGVFLSLIKTDLNLRERFFCMLAYTPKATVQAAIGSIPLAMGLSSGQLVLTVAVVAILLTAPLGALAIDVSYKRLLLPQPKLVSNFADTDPSKL